MDKTKREIRKMRKLWEISVNKALAEEKESRIIIDARKKLLMGLFDDSVIAIEKGNDDLSEEQHETRRVYEVCGTGDR